MAAQGILLFNLAIQKFQLFEQNRRLDGIQTCIDTNAHIVIFGFAMAVDAQRMHQMIQFFVVRKNCTTIAIAT